MTNPVKQLESLIELDKAFISPQESVEHYHAMLDFVDAAAEPLLAYIRKLEETLKFYADPEHWGEEVREEACGCCTSFDGFQATDDGGARARAALEEGE